MKRAFALTICLTLSLCASSCTYRQGNPTVDGAHVWENSDESTVSEYNISESYTLNYNVADALAAHAKAVDENSLALAQEIISGLDQYPEFTDDKDINYVVKLRSVYKCVVGFYYMNSSYGQLNSLIDEYNKAYEELSNNSKTFYLKINNNLFMDAANQFEQYGKTMTNS